jgi:hypothetical protein
LKKNNKKCVFEKKSHPVSNGEKYSEKRDFGRKKSSGPFGPKEKKQ